MDEADGFFVVGYLARASMERPSWLSAELLPDRLWSASNCFTKQRHGGLCDYTAEESEASDQAGSVPNTRILALALPLSDRAALLADIGSTPDAFGCAEVFRETIARRRPAVGTVLGFDVLGNDGDVFHSWLCHGLEVDVERVLGITVGSTGLLLDLAAARSVAEYAITLPESADVDLWLPFALVETET